MKIKRASNILALVLLALSLNGVAASVPSEQVIAELGKLKKVGQAEMRWLMFPLYRVALKTPDGRYQPERLPQALHITYHRNIHRDDLITATDQQWQRLGVTEEQRAKWLVLLKDIWPSVKRGDSLILTVNKEGKAHFLYNDKVIGALEDKQFGRSFLNIWLSPKTSQPGIRQRLIGALNETS